MRKTIVRMFKQTAQAFPHNVYMKENRGAGYVSATYAEVAEETRKVGGFLVSLGISKGDRVTILAEGRNSWISAELGVFCSGAISVPVSVKIKEREEILFRVKHSGSRLAMTTALQLDKLAPLVGSLPDLQAVLIMDPIPDGSEKAIGTIPLIPWSQVLEQGKAFLDAHPGALDEIESSLSEDDPATLTYTSGTTAEPKGIVLSHKNYWANVEGADVMYPLPIPLYTLLILPWDHSFAHTAGLYTFMKKGSVVGAVEPAKTEIGTIRNIPKNIKEIGPTYLLVVPALVENFRKNIAGQIRQKGGLSALLFGATIRMGTRVNGDAFRKRRDPLSLILWPPYLLLRSIIRGKVKASLGGRLVFMVSGGSACPTEHVRWFTALGIPVYQGYGLSETSPIISANTNLPGHFKMGSSGKPFPWVRLRIEDEAGQALPTGQVGEICVAGDSVMLCYWKNPAATADAVKDGWFHTGDLGYQDRDGFLWVVGRIKSLLVGQNGEKYSPEALEAHLATNVPLIRQVMLYNQQNPFTVALIVPEVSEVRSFAKANGLSLETDSGLDAVIHALRQALLRYRKDPALTSLFVADWTPKTFAILPEDFTEENQMINSAMKMVRRHIVKRYTDRIDALYGADEDPVNATNRSALKAWLAAKT